MKCNFILISNKPLKFRQMDR